MVVLWLLYGVQCVGWLPAQGVGFVRLLGDWFTATGPGFRALHPLPSGRALRAARFPLTERDGRLFAAVPVTWWSSQKTLVGEHEVSLEDLATARANAETVHVAARPLARLASPGEALAFAEFLRRLAVAPPDVRRQCADRLLRERLSHQAYAARCADVSAVTLWLGRLADTYAGVGLLLVPAGILAFGAERTLFAAWPVVTALHLAVLLAFARAYRRLLPGEAGARSEALLACALYPPLLLRARHDLATRSLGSFHPAAVAAVALPQHERDRVLRCELLAARRADALPTGSLIDLAGIELAALRELAESVGASETSLLAPPDRGDPRSVGYCPACRGEYRRASGDCNGCGVALEAFDA